MRVEAFAATDPGPVREQNEDRWHIDIDGALFVVADGMGGHAAGEVAATIAVETVSDVLLGEIDPEETVLVATSSDSADLLHERLRYAMNQAAIRIRAAARKEPMWHNMGTTLVVLVLEDGQSHLAHVGDSRAYLLRGGELRRLTRDHTVVQQEVDAGRLTPELARIVPHKNILTRSVGPQGPVDPDTSTRPVMPGDVFVLCSDGLTDPLDDAALADICRSTHPEDLATTLVNTALARGADDNVTVMVVVVHEP